MNNLATVSKRLKVVQSARLVTPTPFKEQGIVYPAQFGRKLSGMLQVLTCSEISWS